MEVKVNRLYTANTTQQPMVPYMVTKKGTGWRGIHGMEL